MWCWLFRTQISSINARLGCIIKFTLYYTISSKVGSVDRLRLLLSLQRIMLLHHDRAITLSMLDSNTSILLLTLPQAYFLGAAVGALGDFFFIRDVSAIDGYITWHCKFVSNYIHVCWIACSLDFRVASSLFFDWYNYWPYVCSFSIILIHFIQRSVGHKIRAMCCLYWFIAVIRWWKTTLYVMFVEDLERELFCDSHYEK